MKLHPGWAAAAWQHGSESEPGTRKDSKVLVAMCSKLGTNLRSPTSRASCDDTYLSIPRLLTAVPQQCFATAAGQRFSP